MDRIVPKAPVLLSDFELIDRIECIERNEGGPTEEYELLMREASRRATEYARNQKLLDPNPAAGPLCQGHDYYGACVHLSCHDISDGLPAVAFCKEHGFQVVVNVESSTGFAGGTIYFAELACGHFDVDESDDVRAAY